MIILGLTGSIGMGKSTAAGFFAEEGAAVYSADETVHNLYKQPAIAAEIAAAFPQAAENGAVSRPKLARSLFADKTAAEQKQALARLEAIIHPHIRAEEEKFVQKARADGYRLAVLDIPLLFETLDKNRQKEQPRPAAPRFDYIAVVSAPYAVQKARVLARPGMNAEKFAALAARQLSDAEKRARADFILDTGQGLEHTRQQIRALAQRLCAAAGNPV